MSTLKTVIILFILAIVLANAGWIAMLFVLGLVLWGMANLSEKKDNNE